MKKWLKTLSILILIILVVFSTTFYIYRNSNSPNSDKNLKIQENDKIIFKKNPTKNNEKEVPYKNPYEEAPSDGSCLFWSVATAYLLADCNNDIVFKEKYENLFGKEHEKDRTEVENLIKKYYANPSKSKHDPFFQSQIVGNLVRNVFRNKIVDYIQNKIDKEKTIPDENHRFYTKLILNTLNDESSENLTDNEKIKKYINEKRELDKWGDTPEVIAMTNVLKCKILYKDQKNKEQEHINEIINSEEKKYIYKPIELCYHNQMHYDFYLPKKQDH